MFHRLCLVMCCTLSLTLVSGCGPAPLKREFADVTGKITFKGKPLTSGTVVFQPAAGSSIVSEIKADGTYSLKGVIGPNTVMISNEIPDPGPGEADPVKRKAALAAIEKSKEVTVPARYGTPASGMKFDVKKGDNKADFDVPPQ